MSVIPSLARATQTVIEVGSRLVVASGVTAYAAEAAALAPLVTSLTSAYSYYSYTRKAYRWATWLTSGSVPAAPAPIIVVVYAGSSETVRLPEGTAPLSPEILAAVEQAKAKLHIPPATEIADDYELVEAAPSSIAPTST